MKNDDAWHSLVHLIASWALLEWSPLSSISKDLRTTIVLFRACYKVDIFCMSPLVIFMYCVSGKKIHLACKTRLHCLHFHANNCSSFCQQPLQLLCLCCMLPNPLLGVRSIVFTKDMFTSLKPNHVSSWTKGLEIPSQLLRWGANSTFLCYFMLFYFIVNFVKISIGFW